MLRKLLHYLNLENELEDFDLIHKAIEDDIVFKGTNLWILVFAILVASVGLNMNSPAVVIGAMLISPLMGPINGMGYSIATYNFPLFRRAFKNFIFAVIASLIASTTYFAISPVSTAHSELLARTSPTIYDVLIALFGGLAGIVAISSKRKGNVIPGVAIATALMPPLCTAGYGLATAQFAFFFGAGYLFLINTVFIALSSVLFSQVFKFPIKTIIDGAQKVKINRYISVVIIVMLVPSVYFGYRLVQKESFIEKSNRYIASIKIVEGNYLIKSEIHPEKRSIHLVYTGKSLSKKTKEIITNQLQNFSIEGTELKIDDAVPLSEPLGQDNETLVLKGRINELTKIIAEKSDSAERIKTTGYEVFIEVRELFPQVKACILTNSLVHSTQDLKPKETKLVVLTITGNVSAVTKAKIENWLKIRLKTTDLKVVFELGN